MEPLKVNPRALTGYGTVLDQAVADFDVNRGYVKKFGDLVSEGEGWLSTLIGPHRSLMGYVEKSMLGALSDSTHGSSKNLATTAEYYRMVESKVARKFDEGLIFWDRDIGATGLVKTHNSENGPARPPGTWPPATDGNGRDLADLLYPTDARTPESLKDPIASAFDLGHYGNATSPLTQPGTPREFEDPNAFYRTIANWVSPAWWVEKVLNAFDAENPFAKCSKLIAGDWTAYAKASEMWKHVGESMTIIGSNLDTGNQALDGQWDGNAAEAAFIQFRNLANVTRKGTGLFDHLSEAYATAARGVWGFAKASKDLMDCMFNAVVWGAVALGFGVATSETGVGAAAGAGGVAAAAAKFWGYWTDLGGAIDKTEQVVHSAVGNIMALSGGDSLFGGLDVPASYEAPGVT